MPTRVVDGLAFVGPSLFGPTRLYDALAEDMDRAGIDAAVVIASRPPDYHLPPANDAVAALQAEHPGQVIGLARIDANRPDAGEETRRCVQALGLRGVFLHPREEVFAVNDPKVDRVLDVCAELEAAVVVAAGHPWVSEALQVAELAARYPDTRIVMTNGGQLNISGLGQLDALLALRACPNLCVQTSGVYRQDFLEGVVRDLGATRVMFAAGGPQFDPAYEILRVRLAEISDADKDMLLGGTAARVFSL